MVVPTSTTFLVIYNPIRLPPKNCTSCLQGLHSVCGKLAVSYNRAIGAGKFIFIASHGGSEPGSFSLSVLPHIQYLPSDIQPSHVGEDLQFVYFSGCYTGKLENEWKEVLRLDDAILFDRLSAVDEHMLWAWLISPSVIKNLQ